MVSARAAESDPDASRTNSHRADLPIGVVWRAMRSSLKPSVIPYPGWPVRCGRLPVTGCRTISAASRLLRRESACESFDDVFDIPQPVKSWRSGHMRRQDDVVERK